MLPYRNVLKPYGQYWFVTITPYGRDIEPNVPDKEKVMDDFKELSDIVGVDSMGWRYDPILVDDKHSVEWHITEFEKMAENLCGYTKSCVISFIDIYKMVNTFETALHAHLDVPKRKTNQRNGQYAWGCYS